MRFVFRGWWESAGMTDSQEQSEGARATVDDSEVKAREREKLDIGDSHPEDRDIRPGKDKRDPDELDVGDPHPADRDA
jgi:hypothetical protein